MTKISNCDSCGSRVPVNCLVTAVHQVRTFTICLNCWGEHSAWMDIKRITRKRIAEYRMKEELGLL